MPASEVLDVSRLIDERKLSAFNLKLLVLCFLAVLFDGYDIGAVAFAGPYLIKEWSITSMADLGPVIAASLAGIVVGSPVFGYVGDRFGRKAAIIGSMVAFGIFTLAAVKAGGVRDLLYLRFLAGIGLGGLMPNVNALTAEFSPRRIRATMIIVMFSGITIGGAVPGVVSASLAPEYGWQILFYIGGIAPLLLAIVLAAALPESIKFLVLKTERRGEILATLLRLVPGGQFRGDARIVIGEEAAAHAGFRPSMLFAGYLKWMTPLLWLLFVCDLLSFNFIFGWTPIVLSQAQVSRETAALATSVFQIGGTIGGLALARPIDKFGVMPVSLSFMAAMPIVGAIGFLAWSAPLLLGILFLAGFCLIGILFALNALSALVYPTAIRSNGSGWALGVGRFGSAAGPIIGGYLIDMKLSPTQLFMTLLVPLGIGTLASIFATRIYYGARMRGPAVAD